MTADYADSAGVPYHITTIYTDKTADKIPASSLIAEKQEKQTILDTYDSFMEIMNVMVFVLALAAVLLGIVVLYNLGVMSYIERSRELATLKVLGFRRPAYRKNIDFPECLADSDRRTARPACRCWHIENSACHAGRRIRAEAQSRAADLLRQHLCDLWHIAGCRIYGGAKEQED